MFGLIDERMNKWVVESIARGMGQYVNYTLYYNNIICLFAFEYAWRMLWREKVNIVAGFVL